MPNSKLRVAIKQIEDCKLIKQELELTKAGNEILEKQLLVKDSEINGYEIKDSLSKVRFALGDDAIKNLKKQVANEKAISTIYQIKLKTARINKWIFGGGGLIIGALAGFLFVK